MSDGEYIIPICVVPRASNFPKNFSSAGVNGESAPSLGALSVSCAGASVIIFANAVSIIYSNVFIIQLLIRLIELNDIY